ncbi:Yip1 domain-containing protein [Laceyella tengchongensis]|jgi:hypothetical protein|uniref:Yip1 domain-containing protein n=1 Tax=Laceyella tengchongensis TaxID=574699 RepID=A0AA45WPJ4_9BACL|nr:hypothetical protein [Laceyella tengchongensis]SMP21136.1 Yip1 domain-containing protein [Laceyella tengchongensis]
MLVLDVLRVYWVQLIKQPKNTIRQAMEETSTKLLFVLISLFGITLCLEQAMNRDAGDTTSIPVILLLSMVIGPILGAVAWFLGSLCTFGVARLFGGVATFRETSEASAWATVAYTTKMALFIPMLLIFRQENFTSNTPDIDSSMFLALLFFLCLTANFVMTIYYIIVHSKIIGEIHEIGSWKGFASIILVPLVLILLLFLLALSQ